eukprot:m.190337 g.190337  ORF g.190337 m.190337 type:complete len:87 (-) comp16756_c0_seq2:123-383(-)
MATTAACLLAALPEGGARASQDVHDLTSASSILFCFFKCLYNQLNKDDNGGASIVLHLLGCLPHESLLSACARPSFHENQRPGVPR